MQIGFLEPNGCTTQEDALKKIRAVHKALGDQAHGGRDYLGVLGVPAVRSFPYLHDFADNQHEGIGTVKMHRKTNRQPIDHAGSGAMAAVSAASTSNILSPFSHQTTPLHPSEDEDDSGSESLDDDGLTSDSSDYESGVEDHDEDGLPTLQESPSMLDDTVQTVYNAHIGLPPASKSQSNDDKQVPKTAGVQGSRTPGQKPPGRQTSLPGYFDEESGGNEISIPSTPGNGLTTPSGSRKRIPGFRRSKSRAASKKSNRKDFNFDVGSAADVQGIVVMEIQGASDLPKLKNGMSHITASVLMIALRFSFDMDPFVVISFGKKVFRTRVIRHQLNPVWDEKLVFHVRRNENAFTIQFAVLDWDKVSYSVPRAGRVAKGQVSGNDMIGACTLPLSQLMDDAPHPDAETGLYDPEEDGKHESKTFAVSAFVPA